MDGGRPRPSTSGTDRRWQLMMPTTTRHSQVVTSRLVARIRYMPQDRSDLKFASMQVCCAIAKPSVRDVDGVKRIGRYFAGERRAKCGYRWQQSGELEAYSDADWRGDKATRRSVSAGVLMRGGHCLKVWTKKQKWCRCSPPRASCTPQSKPPQKGWRSRAWPRTWG